MNIQFSILSFFRELSEKVKFLLCTFLDQEAAVYVFRWLPGRLCLEVLVVEKFDHA